MSLSEAALRKLTKDEVSDGIFTLEYQAKFDNTLSNQPDP